MTILEKIEKNQKEINILNSFIPFVKLMEDNGFTLMRDSILGFSKIIDKEGLKLVAYVTGRYNVNNDSEPNIYCVVKILNAQYDYYFLQQEFSVNDLNNIQKWIDNFPKLKLKRFIATVTKTQKHVFYDDPKNPNYQFYDDQWKWTNTEPTIDVKPL